MSRTRKQFGMSSLDMLLDTMCNTFGGVCFIALLVAIISAALPKPEPEEPAVEEEEQEQVAEQELEERQALVDSLAKSLTSERDSLKESVRITRTFIASQTATNAIPRTALEWQTAIRSNETAVAELSRRREDLQKEVADSASANKVNEVERKRLARLAEELDDKKRKSPRGPQRVVRLPNERQVGGLSSIDLWLHEGEVYELDNTEQVSRSGGGLLDEIKFTIRPGCGARVTKAFLSSGRWNGLLGSATSGTYVRIWADRKSFNELCMIRDDLIGRHLQYNWHDSHGLTTLSFVHGYDGHIQ